MSDYGITENIINSLAAVGGTQGDRTLSIGFIAQYAAEAVLKTAGVHSLDFSTVAHLKESLGIEHSGKGVKVAFAANNENLIHITIYPVIYYGYSIPDVAWQIQENVRDEVQRYTDLIVEQVNVHVKDIVLAEKKI